MSSIEDYAWLEKDEDLFAFCISILVGATAPRVAEAFGILPETERLATAADMWGLIQAHFDQGLGCVQIGALENAIVAYECNGWEGIDPPFVKALAAPVHASFFVNVNARMDFVYARDGGILRCFDPLMYDDGGEPLLEERDLDFGLPHPRASAMLLLERLTGIHVSQDFLMGEARPTYLRKI